MFLLLHYWLVDELYDSGWEFYKQTGISLLRVIGNAIIVAVFLGQNWDTWGLFKLLGAVFLLPSASIAISFPAATLVLLLTYIFPEKFNLLRFQLRPLIVAVLSIGSLVLAVNLLFPLSFWVQKYITDLSGFTGFISILIYFVAMIFLALLLLVCLIFIPFHTENSYYGIPLLSSKAKLLSAISFGVATTIAALIAFSQGTAPLPLLLAVILSNTSSILTYLLSDNDIELADQLTT